jgi:hypothetical protein
MQLSRTKRQFIRLFRNPDHSVLFAVIHDPEHHRFMIERTAASHLGWERVSDVPYGAGSSEVRGGAARTREQSHTDAIFIAGDAADNCKE